MGDKLKRHIPLLVIVAAFAYFSMLSSKSYTWVFVSEDAADWLTASNWWIVPQPLGSPLYIFLGHLLNLLPGDMVLKMTLLLSCLPAAITVGLVYMITRKLAEQTRAGVMAALVLTGAIVFLSQATILEEYALAVMFLTLAYWLRLQDYHKLVWVVLGLSCAVHSLMFPVVIVWLVVEYKLWRRNLKALPLFLLCGVLPYSYVLILMAMDTPRFMAGGLNWTSIQDYFMGPGGHISGTLSIFDFPRRLLEFSTLVLASFGVALIPMWKGAKEKFPIKGVILSGLIIALWFYLTCFFKTAWVFMIIGCPAAAILAGIGASKLRLRHLRIVAGGATALIVINLGLLNADVLTAAKPTAQTLYNEIMELPEGSVVVGTPRYTTTAMYCLSRGKDIVPLTACYLDSDPYFIDYKLYLEEEWELTGNNSFEMIQSAWRQGREVYYAGYNRGIVNEEACLCYWFSGSGQLLREIRGFTGVPSPFAPSVTGTSEKQ